MSLGIKSSLEASQLGVKLGQEQQSRNTGSVLQFTEQQLTERAKEKRIVLSFMALVEISIELLRNCMMAGFQKNRMKLLMQSTLTVTLNVARGKALKSKAKPIIGYSDVSTVKLDFDGYSPRVVRNWAKRICRFFKLRGFLILKSSLNNYHVVFDRAVSWVMNVHIFCWTALMIEGKQLRNLPLTRYALMQGIKESSCLRVGRKKSKPSPRIVFRFGEQNSEIKKFMDFRRRLAKIEKEKI